MGQARSSTSAHLSFETVRFPGRSFMSWSPLSMLLRESEGSLVKDRPQGRVCEFGCVFASGQAGRLQVEGKREEAHDW